MRIRAREIAVTIAALGAIASIPVPAGAAPLEAEVVRTKYGVPHITANNLKALAAGYGYAFAEDNLCTIANEYVTVNGKRSKSARVKI